MEVSFSCFGIALSLGDSFHVVVSTRKESEQNLAKRLSSNRSKSVLLNPGTPGVIKISFHLAS